MKRPEWAMLTTIALAGIPQTVQSAEPAPLPKPLPKPLDDAFLEYLTEFEDESDNWTWFADDAAPAPQTLPATPQTQPVTRTPTHVPAKDADKDIQR